MWQADMVRRHLISLVAVLLVGAACGSTTDSEGTTTAPAPTAAATTTSATTTSLTGSTTTADADPAPLSIGMLLDTRPPGAVAVGGTYYDDGAGPLLCEALAESFPPQCAGRWLILSTVPEADIVTEGAVSWTDTPLVLSGTVDGDYFVIEGTELPVPTGEDNALVEALVAFARAQGELDALPLGDEVALGLAAELLTMASPAELADPGAWQLDVEFFRARTGPFSALELLAPDRPHRIIVGPHNHCASPPVRAPEGFADHHRISIQPEDVTSCIEWFTVDLFVGETGAVEAITLDLFEP